MRRVLGGSWGGLGRDFGAILGVWAGSGSQVRLGRRFGRLLGDFRIGFYTVLAPTWSHLGPQVGVILTLKIIQEPPKTPPKTHLGARAPPNLQNWPKMTTRPPKMRPQTPHLGSILTSLLDIQTNLFKHFENDFAPFTGWIVDSFLYCMGLWI